MLSKEQEYAYDKILNGKERIMTLGGVAGSGKSHLVSEIAKEVPIKIITPTWKAALVLHKRGYKDARTVHDLLLKPRKDEAGNLHFVEDDEKGQRARWQSELLVVDEASMINSFHYQTIIRNWGGRILFVGDHCQLPPINSAFSVMSSPDLLLTEIHRQAAGNPVIQLATHVREGGSIRDLPKRAGSPDAGYAIGEEGFRWAINQGAQVICKYNTTRTFWNHKLRKSSENIIKGDKLILVDNQPWRRLFNGMQVEVVEDFFQGDPLSSDMCIFDGEETRSIQINTFNLLNPKGVNPDDLAQQHGINRRHIGVGVDYSYAITCHKAQGSSFRDVAIVLEGTMDPKWLYTAITRAENGVYIW